MEARIVQGDGAREKADNDRLPASGDGSLSGGPRGTKTSPTGRAGPPGGNEVHGAVNAKRNEKEEKHGPDTKQTGHCSGVADGTRAQRNETKRSQATIYDTNSESMVSCKLRHT